MQQKPVKVVKKYIIISWSEKLDIIQHDLSGWNQLAEKC